MNTYYSSGNFSQRYPHDNYLLLEKLAIYMLNRARPQFISYYLVSKEQLW